MGVAIFLILAFVLMGVERLVTYRREHARHHPYLPHRNH
jgi:hypothetical protein